MPMKLYAHPDKYLTKKMLIAAEYAGLAVEIPKNAGKDEGRIPVLETDSGSCIFATGAITRYLGRLRRDVPLYGQNLLESGMIDSWTEFSTHELEVPLCTWVNATGMSLPAEVTERAKTDTTKALAVLNNHLLHFTYMVGESISLADISLACAIAEGCKKVLTPDVTKSFGNLMRWFKLCTDQPEFQKVLGKTSVAVPAAAPKKEAAAPKKEAAAPKKEAAAPKKEAPKKDEKPKAAAAAPKAAPAAGGPVDEAAVKACGDEIRVLKEKLKGEGIKGKKLDAHPEVAALVAKLQELKSAA